MVVICADKQSIDVLENRTKEPSFPLEFLVFRLVTRVGVGGGGGGDDGQLKREVGM